MADTNELIPKDTLDNLNQFKKLLNESSDSMEVLLNKFISLTNEVKKGTATFESNAKAAQKVAEAENDLSEEEQRQIKIKQQIQKLENEIKRQNSDEVRQLEQLRQQRNKNQRALRNDVKEQNAASNSLEQLRGRLNRMRQEYDNLSDSIRKSANGKLLKDQIKALSDYIKQEEALTGRTGRNVGNYPQGGGILGGIGAVFGGNVLTSAITSVKDALAGLINTAKEFVSEGIQMAQKAEGVTRAFSALNNPDLLSNLREATKGTVNDLELMQTAVRAQNFNIPLENLGNLLKFAQQRAQQTGESVDYLVNSIIDGIGRKSTLILDNLQISAGDIQQRVKETGDYTTAVIDLVNEKLAQQGDLALTAADKEAQANAKRQNAQLAIGRQLTQIQGLWSTLTGSFYETIGNLAERYLPSLLSNIELVVNKFIEWYNSSDFLRAQVSKLYLGLNILFINFKRDIKIALAGLGTFADIMKNLSNLNFREAARNYTSFLQKVASTAVQYGKEAQEALINARETAQTLLEPIQITTNLNYDDVVVNNKGGGVDAIIGLIAIQEEKLKKLNQKYGDLNKINNEETLRRYNQEKQAIENEINRLRNLGVINKQQTNQSIERNNAEIQASQELALFLVNQNAETNKAILEDNKRSYDDRMQAVDDYEARMKESINQRLENQLKDQALTDSQRALLELKAQAEINKINEEGAKYRQQIVKDYVEEQQKIVTDAYNTRLQALDNSQQEELAILAEMYSKGGISQEDYEKRKTDITKEFAKERFDAEVASMRSLLDISGLTAEQRQEIEKKILNAELSYNRTINQQKIKEQEDYAQKMLDIEKKLSDERKKLINELYESSFELITTLFDAQTERNLQRLEKESEDNEKWQEKEQERIERQEEAGVITKEQAEAQKAAIDQQAEVREEQIEAQRKEIQNAQAKREKAFALARVGIDTASAVMKNLALYGFILAQPLNAATIALGAVQAATILAQPLPAYKDGTEDHGGGLAIVGDGNRSEMVVTPFGNVYKTPDRPTLVDLPKHSVVLPDFSKAMMAYTPMVRSEDKSNVVVMSDKEGVKAIGLTNKKLDKVCQGINAIRENSKYNNQAKLYTKF